jgi:hypothetical protein
MSKVELDLARYTKLKSRILTRRLNDAKQFLEAFRKEEFFNEEIYREVSLEDDDPIDLDLTHKGGFCVSSSLTGILGSENILASDRAKLINEEYLSLTIYRLVHELNLSISLPSSVSDFLSQMDEIDTLGAIVGIKYNDEAHASAVVPLVPAINLYGQIDTMKSREPLFISRRELTDLYSSADVTDLALCDENSTTYFLNQRFVIIIKENPLNPEF